VIVLLCVGVMGVGARAGATSNPLDTVAVAGATTAEPTLQFATPLSVSTTSKRTVDAGSGAIASPGQRATFRYLLVNGRTGKEIPGSYRWNPANILLNANPAHELLVDAISGSAVGSRVLVAAPVRSAAVKRMVKAKSLKSADTLLVLLDLLDLHTPLASVSGPPGPAGPPGMPSVTVSASGTPEVAVPTGPPPKDLLTTALVEGDGDKVDVGQNILVQYVGLIWRNGKTFDTTWTSGLPIQVPLGVGQVMTGWDNALLGRTVGSRVLMVVPPDQGYGADGNPRAGIEPDDTLIFVVDILDAWR
jgi:peptidylprolyl isomerase